MVSYHMTKGEQLEGLLNNTFKEIEDISEEEVQSDMYCTFIPLEMN